MVATYLRVSDHAIGCAELHVELYIDQADGGAGDGGGGTAVPVAMEEGGFTIKSEGTTAALLIRIDGLSPTYQVSGLRLRARATVDGPGSHGTTSLLIVTGS
jgi:hypothetical protein